MNYLASVLLVLIGGAMCFASDFYIRARGLDGINGLNAQSWDVMSTIIVLVGLVGFAVSFYLSWR